jgi:putative ABC transport system permease protein
VAAAVMSQSFWIGVIGILIGLPTVFGLARLAELAGVKAQLGPELLGAVTAITLVMAMVSGLIALRSLRLIEPANLLR